MLITEMNVDELISKVPELYRDTKTPEEIKGMTMFKSFYLSGGVGVGKTHQIWAYYIWNIRINSEGIEHGLCRQIDNVKIVNVPLMIQDMMGKSFDARDSMIDILMNTPMLILDDIGTERQTDYNEMMIHNIVEHRYITKKYTGFTSNIKLNKLHYDVRVVSRIKGIVGNNFGVMVGGDRRVV